MQPFVPYPSWNDRKDPLYQILLAKRMEAAGIVPINPGTEQHDVNRDLASLPPEEQRRIKRKFRKAWRTAAKKNLQRAGNSKKAQVAAARRSESELGLKSTSPPNRKQKRNRKASVNTMFIREAWAARNALQQG